MPRNHGPGAWVFLSSYGGGLVDGDRLCIRVDAAPGTMAFIGTQASTKVYRSRTGSSQTLEIRIAEGAALALVPDPVVAFAGARYAQRIDVVMAPDASIALFDAYTCGRSARGERWQFARFESKTTIARDGRVVLVDSTRLDPAHGSVSDRMAGFDVIGCVVAIGPRFAGMRSALREAVSSPPRARTLCSASPLGNDGLVLRFAADHFENASCALRPSFRALARELGDDPFVRKW